MALGTRSFALHTLVVAAVLAAAAACPRAYAPPEEDPTPLTAAEEARIEDYLRNDDSAQQYIKKRLHKPGATEEGIREDLRHQIRQEMLLTRAEKRTYASPRLQKGLEALFLGKRVKDERADQISSSSFDGAGGNEHELNFALYELRKRNPAMEALYLRGKAQWAQVQASLEAQAVDVRSELQIPESLSHTVWRSYRLFRETGVVPDDLPLRETDKEIRAKNDTIVLYGPKPDFTDTAVRLYYQRRLLYHDGDTDWRKSIAAHLDAEYLGWTRRVRTRTDEMAFRAAREALRLSFAMGMPPKGLEHLSAIDVEKVEIIEQGGLNDFWVREPGKDAVRLWRSSPVFHAFRSERGVLAHVGLEPRAFLNGPVDARQLQWKARLVALHQFFTQRSRLIEILDDRGSREKPDLMAARLWRRGSLDQKVDSVSEEIASPTEDRHYGETFQTMIWSRSANEWDALAESAQSSPFARPWRDYLLGRATRPRVWSRWVPGLLLAGALLAPVVDRVFHGNLRGPGETFQSLRDFFAGSSKPPGPPPSPEGTSSEGRPLHDVRKSPRDFTTVGPYTTISGTEGTLIDPWQVEGPPVFRVTGAGAPEVLEFASENDVSDPAKLSSWSAPGGSPQYRAEAIVGVAAQGPKRDHFALALPRGSALHGVQLTDPDGNEVRVGKEIDIFETERGVPVAVWRSDAKRAAPNSLHGSADFVARARTGEYSVPVERLLSVVNELREAGFVPLANRLEEEARARSNGRIPVAVLAKIVADEGLYTYLPTPEFDPRKIPVSNRFRDLARYLGPGKRFASQCTGFRDLAGRLIAFSADPKDRLVVRYLNVLVHPDSQGFFRVSSEHAQLAVAPEGSRDEEIVDATASNKDPRAPGKFLPTKKDLPQKAPSQPWHLLALWHPGGLLPSRRTVRAYQPPAALAGPPDPDGRVERAHSEVPTVSLRHEDLPGQRFSDVTLDRIAREIQTLRTLIQPYKELMPTPERPKVPTTMLLGLLSALHRYGQGSISFAELSEKFATFDNKGQEKIALYGIEDLAPALVEVSKRLQASFEQYARSPMGRGANAIEAYKRKGFLQIVTEMPGALATADLRRPADAPEGPSLGTRCASTVRGVSP